MSIMIKLFLVLYLLAVALVTIFSVIWLLSLIFKPEWATKKVLSIKYHINKSA